jgi:cob(I)alamin adenosyltransferase
MSRIATGTGDEGRTSLFSGDRVSKAHPKVEAYGTVDELNAALGQAFAVLDEDTCEQIERVQEELFAIGAELATPGDSATRIQPEHVTWLEERIDELEDELPRMDTFVLPSGSDPAARLHFARSVCRRAERRIVALHESDQGPVRETVRVYVNRLSDWLFLQARREAIATGEEAAMDFSRFQDED